MPEESQLKKPKTDWITYSEPIHETKEIVKTYKRLFEKWIKSAETSPNSKRKVK